MKFKFAGREFGDHYDHNDYHKEPNQQRMDHILRNNLTCAKPKTLNSCNPQL